MRLSAQKSMYWHMSVKFIPIVRWTGAKGITDKFLFNLYGAFNNLPASQRGGRVG
jgi:hypothetical protein